jgi:aryl-alcohol dehydrogenase-like predicted oxidoreductase
MSTSSDAPRGKRSARKTSPTLAESRLATAGGTARLAERVELAVDAFRPLGGGPLVSSIGIGTYLGECTDEDDRQTVAALARALERGINLIDTAINYRCQRAERCVGRALAESIAAGVVRRDEVVVCTKGGYLPLDGTPPDSREAYQAYVRDTFLDTGLLTSAELVGGAHAIAPAFLADQIARSRANLGLAAIDVYYLHNPEQQLDAVQPARFRTMMRHAFALLEERVAAGEIGAYGLATWNGVRVPPETKGHLSLHEMVTLARDVAGDAHHLRVVQMPINLAMPEALRAPTQSLGGRRTVTALEAAAELGLAVVASAPLMQGRLAAGLPPDVRRVMDEVFPALTTDAQRALAFVRTLPGVTAALVGMKSEAHVEENVAAL